MEERFLYVSRFINYGLEVGMSSLLDSRFRYIIEILELVKLQWEMIKATMKDVEDMVITNQFSTPWFNEMKQLACDAEDVLDECDYELRKAEDEYVETQKTSVNSFEDVGEDIFAVYILDRNPLFQKGVLEIFERIKKWKNYMLGDHEERLKQWKFDMLEHHAIDEVKIADENKTSYDTLDEEPTCPYPLITNDSIPILKACFVGREQDMRELIPLLLSESPSFSLLGVVGTGGIGKTTIAKELFTHPEVKNHFHLEGWVCASNGYNVVTLTKNILESFKIDCSDFTQLDLLQIRLKKNVTGKKFLLVLDDIWDDSCELWEKVFVPLKFAAGGSKILITTRNRSITRAIPGLKCHYLEYLSEESSWLLFSSYAFDGERSSRQSKFEEIGKKIIEKCEGLPLSLKVLGRHLGRHTNDKNEWLKVLESDVWIAYDKEKNLLPSLLLSYDRLPLHLKPCFKFYATFPKSYKITQAKLVQLWIANNLIETDTNENAELENRGMSYLYELLSRSLFELAIERHYDFEEDEEVMVHDLICDMVKYVSGKEYDSILTNSPVKLPSVELQHVSLDIKCLESGMDAASVSVPESNRLHTLVIGLKLRVGIEYCKSLRILDLSCMTEEVPDYSCIGNLKHLRYLNLSGKRNLEVVPDSIFALYHLQLLDLSETNIEQLPDSVGKLKKLRNLAVSGTKMSSLPHSICELHNLQVMDIRKTSITRLPGDISRLTNLRYIYMDYVLNIQKSLEKVSRSLVVQSLEDFSVSTMKDNDLNALITKMSNKICFRLCNLTWYPKEEQFSFTPRQCRSELEAVLQIFTPEDELKTVYIKAYDDSILPDPHHYKSFGNVSRIKFSECQSCISVAPLQQLPSLRILELDHMNSLTEISDPCNIADQIVPSKAPFHCLTKLSVSHCCSLKSLPILRALIKLTVYSCDSLSNIPSYQSMKELGVYYSKSLENIPRFQSLETLAVMHCEFMKNIPISEPLRTLEIEYCPHVTSLQNLSIPQYTTIYECKNLGIIEFMEKGQSSSSSNNNSSLTYFGIASCPEVSLPPEALFPSSLEDLTIFNCPLLEKFCQDNNILYKVEKDLFS